MKLYVFSNGQLLKEIYVDDSEYRSSRDLCRIGKDAIGTTTAVLQVVYQDYISAEFVTLY